MYTTTNFKTKKALKAAVAAGHKVTVFSPGLPDREIEPISSTETKTVYLEGPHYPEPHRWYAEAIIEGGIIVRIR